MASTMIGLVVRSALTPPTTPLDAGRAWFIPHSTAGTPDRTVDDGARILASVEVAAGRRMVLYTWRRSATTPANALSVVPLGLEYRQGQFLPWWPRRGWHPAGTAGPQTALPQGDELYAGSMAVGFCGLSEPIATAWGLSARASRARITWSDGAVTEALFAGGAFIATRPDPNYRGRPAERLSVLRVEALDSSGATLAEQVIPRDSIPQVRGPGRTGGPAVR